MADDPLPNELLNPTYTVPTLPPGFHPLGEGTLFYTLMHQRAARAAATPSDAQPPTNAGGTPGAGTGSDPLSTLASAYMASLGGGGGGAQQQPVVILPAPATEGAGVNWGMIGALAALALVGWAVWTWWKGRHRG